MILFKSPQLSLPFLEECPGSTQLLSELLRLSDHVFEVGFVLAGAFERLVAAYNGLYRGCVCMRRLLVPPCGCFVGGLVDYVVDGGVGCVFFFFFNILITRVWPWRGL